VYKFHKVLYGLKQGPRAWYECLKDFPLKNDFVMGKASLLTKLIRISLFAKYMSMTLYFVLLIRNFVRSLVGS
jgi:hypothetical protein